VKCEGKWGRSKPNDLSSNVDAVALGAAADARGVRVTEVGVTAVVVNEAVSGTAYIDVPSDLTSIADSAGRSNRGARGIMEACEGAVTIEETVIDRAIIAVGSHYLTSVVDAVKNGIVRIQGIVEGGLTAVAVNEAVSIVIAILV